MKSPGIALVSGLLFGSGLAISEMINPEKVLAFLDIAGDWDPSLIIVLAAAMLTASVGFHWALGRSQPLFADAFHLPKKRDIDPQLLIGAAVFGVGWGLAGYCPGPALAALTIGAVEPLIFVLSLLVGSFFYTLLLKKM